MNFSIKSLPLVFLIAASTALAPAQDASPEPGIDPATAEPVVGIWLNRHLMAEGDDAIVAFLDTAKANGITVVMPNFWFHGHVIYPGSTLAEQHPDFVGRDPMALVIREAQARGMKVWPWAEYGFFVHYNTSKDPKESGDILAKHPEWGTVDQAGSPGLTNENMGVMHFSVNPAHPDARRFVQDICLEVAKLYPVDGICLDRIRYMGPDWGYDEYSRGAFRKSTGLDAGSPYVKTEFDGWRREQVTAFMREFSPRWRAEFPGKPIAAAVNPPYMYQGKFQYFADWSKAGLLDVAIPMIYGGSDLVAKEAAATEAMLPEGAQWHAGLDASQDAGTLHESIAAAMEAGADGITIWDDTAFRSEPIDIGEALSGGSR